MISKYYLFIAFVLPAAVRLQNAPVDYLIPPQYELQNVPGRVQAPHHAAPSFMQRVARWLGFGSESIDQQSVLHSSQKAHKDGYIHSNPPVKCYACNNVPWLPFFPAYPSFSSSYDPSSQKKQVSGSFDNYTSTISSNHQNSYFPHHMLSTLRSLPKIGAPISFNPYAPQNSFNRNTGQKSIMFNSPPIKYAPSNLVPPNILLPLEPRQHHLIPIPIPTLSLTPVPPLYDATPFRERHKPNIGYEEPVAQLSQHYEVPHFNSFTPPKKSHSDTKFEIVKSVPVSEFISSVEYPAKIIQSPVIDLSNSKSTWFEQQNKHFTGVSQETKNRDTAKIQYDGEISTNNYQNSGNSQIVDTNEQAIASEIVEKTYSKFEEPLKVPNNVTRHLETTQKYEDISLPGALKIEDTPKLTEIGSFNPRLPPVLDHISEPIIVQNNKQEFDNYPEASSHNVTLRQGNGSGSNFYINFPENLFPPPTTETITTSSYAEELNDKGEQQLSQGNFQPIIQTGPTQFKRDRETPKNLLDLPIYHHQANPGGSFKDNVNKIPVTTHDSKGNQFRFAPTTTPIKFEPTPTSVYSALDASGTWAGITPPVKFVPSLKPQPFQSVLERQSSNLKQIIIPYTMKNHPSPFKTREEQAEQNIIFNSEHANPSHSILFNSNEVQETKPTTKLPASNSNKYLTKILASNVREILRREHEPKNKTKHLIDIKKLQKNIDGWTEQQYTLPSHKASTLSVKGTSKIIPTRYLTTTPSLLKFKTTAVTENPTTITNTFYDQISNFHAQDQVADTNLLRKDEILKSSVPTAHSLTTSLNETEVTTTLKPIAPLYERLSSQNQSNNEIWNTVKVSISPITKEKIYVVTPQPKFSYDTHSRDKVSGFKSPRFQIRPTPAAGPKRAASADAEKIVGRSFTPELFGLLGTSHLTVPSSTDEQSKILRVVTPQNVQYVSPTGASIPESNVREHDTKFSTKS